MHVCINLNKRCLSNIIVFMGVKVKYYNQLIGIWILEFKSIMLCFIMIIIYKLLCYMIFKFLIYKLLCYMFYNDYYLQIYVFYNDYY